MAIEILPRRTFDGGSQSSLHSGDSGPAENERSPRVAKRARASNVSLHRIADQWKDWYYYPGHTFSPLHLLLKDEDRAPARGVDGRTSFYTLKAVEEDGEVVWTLMIVLLEARVEDDRMKRMRRHLYPGAALHLPSELYDIQSLRLQPHHDRLNSALESDDESWFQSSSFALPTPRRSRQILVADLQQPSESANQGGEGVNLARMTFRIPGGKGKKRRGSGVKEEWGTWIDESVARDFNVEIRDHIQRFYHDIDSVQAQSSDVGSP